MIYHKGATQIDQCAHQLMEYQISPDWHGSTVVSDYIAFYHEEKLYTVRHMKKGISCLVYARSPYDAIEKVRAIDAADAIEELSVVVRAQKAVLDKFPRWIPVTERLPEPHKDVLVSGMEAINNSRVYKVMVNDDGIWRPRNYAPSIIWDYWMPIDPPREE